VAGLVGSDRGTGILDSVSGYDTKMFRFLGFVHVRGDEDPRVEEG
jgi:hypothetical protein